MRIDILLVRGVKLALLACLVGGMLVLFGIAAGTQKLFGEEMP